MKRGTRCQTRKELRNRKPNVLKRTTSISSEEKLPKARKYVQRSSTPINAGQQYLCNISLSSIGTKSKSSSAEKTSLNALKRGTKLDKAKTATEKAQKRKRKWKRIVSRDVKKKKTKDSSWETCSEIELSDVSAEESLPRASLEENRAQPLLFEDLPSPEVLREAQCSTCSKLESPLFGIRRKTAAVEDEFVEKEHLPLKDLPTSNVQGYFDSDSDEEFQPVVSAVQKTYQVQKKQRHSKLESRNFVEWLVKLKPHTASSNLLWDEFVKNTYNEVSDQPMNSFPANSRSQTFNETSDSDVIETDGEREKLIDIGKVLKKQKQMLQGVSKMEVTFGYRSRNMKKWKRVRDSTLLNERLYSFPESEDSEMENTDGKRMSIKEFRRRRQRDRAKANLVSEEQGGTFESSETLSMFTNTHVSGMYARTNTKEGEQDKERGHETDSTLVSETSGKPRIVSSELLKTKKKYRIVKHFGCKNQKIE